MTFPVGSISRLKGIPSNWNVETALLFQNFRSLICFQSSPSSWTAFCHSPLSLSSDTPRMAKFFLFLNSLWTFTTLGFSALQGPHQLAQKSTSTYFPL